MKLALFEETNFFILSRLGFIDEGSSPLRFGIGSYFLFAPGRATAATATAAAEEFPAPAQPHPTHAGGS